MSNVSSRLADATALLPQRWYAPLGLDVGINLRLSQLRRFDSMHGTSIMPAKDDLAAHDLS